MNFNLNKKKNLVQFFILIILFLSSLIPIYIYAGTTRVSLKGSAHDLTNETTEISCLNCHWMHQRGDTSESDPGFPHGLNTFNGKFLCDACHCDKDPNQDTAYMIQKFIPDFFYQYKIRHKRETPPGSGQMSSDSFWFPGQYGTNPYRVYNDYESAKAAGLDTGSYHLYYDVNKYPDAFNNTVAVLFSCWDCHNHGIYNTTGGFPGNRLPKLLWSKGDYNTFNISLSGRKSYDSFYATEVFCFSCHSRHAFPKKWDTLSAIYQPGQKSDSLFMETKHASLDRYGTTIKYETPGWSGFTGGGNELRNPFGTGRDISCLVCHAIHASAYPGLMRGDGLDQNTMCQQCHQPPSGPPRAPSTFEFSYVYETAPANYNYITVGHIADKGNWDTGHGKARSATPAGAGLVCSNCHDAHGTGHYKMLEVTVDNPRPPYTPPYSLNSTEIAQLDSLNNNDISVFCAGTCHEINSPDTTKILEWWGWYHSTVSPDRTLDTPMASPYRGKVPFDSSKHKSIYNTAQALSWGNFILKDCMACHDSHGTVNPSLLWKNEEALCFQCHNSNMPGNAPNIEKYFNTALAGNSAASHHPVYTNEQSSTRDVECKNCHNVHIATKNYPTIYPYNWSVVSDSSSYINKYNSLGVRDHENRTRFCVSCHSNFHRRYIDNKFNTGFSEGYYPPGVRIDTTNTGITTKMVGDAWFSTGGSIAGTGHYKTTPDTGLIDCINCHDEHGSSNPHLIRDSAYTDPIDGNMDNFITAEYRFNTAFYYENTWNSRKFCFSADGSVGCHTPQYLTTQVVFPDNLATDAVHHNARKVPFGPLHRSGDTTYLTASFYIDEHDPYYDTTYETPASGIIGCSICHWSPHQPTPDYWYNASGAGSAQYCLDCHRPPEAQPGSYASLAKYYGGAPSNYESTYTEFTSATTTSKHLRSPLINAATTANCKRCHGEHYGTTDQQRHDIPGGYFVRNVVDTTLGDSASMDRRNYLTSSLFCLGCHRGKTEFGYVAPNIAIQYDTIGHGRFSTVGSYKVYCFDCHTKHASSNPDLLRTEIRDVINFPLARDRSIRTEKLNSTYKVQVNVKRDGYQYVCYGCHTYPGDTASYDSSEYDSVNGRTPNPATALWLGKDAYNSSGHGYTPMRPYRDTTYGTTALGMRCSWCHEPHGRSSNTTASDSTWNTTYNTVASLYNDDMLKLEGNVGLCYKCHNKELKDTTYAVYTIANIKELFDSSFSKHNIYATDVITQGRITCLNCHNPHTGSKTNPGVISSNRFEINEGDDRFCVDCHDGSAPTYPTSPRPSVAFPQKAQGSELMTGYDKAYYTASAHGIYTVYCRTCHRPHGTRKKDLLREIYDFNQDNVIGGHSYDTIYTDSTTYRDIYGSAFVNFKEEENCFGCHRDHTGEPDWNTAWTTIPDIRRYYYLNNTTYTKSHHNVFASEQVGADTTWGNSDDTYIECESCHNQHINTKAQPINDPDNTNIPLSAWGDDCITFCLKCHDNDTPPGIKGLTDDKYKNIANEYDPDFNMVYENFTGHYRQKDGKILECRVCHSMHGSRYAKQIRDDALAYTTDTASQIRYMQPVALLPQSNPFSGGDTLAVTSFVEICLSCHSGKTQFYDDVRGVWQDIPIAPPNQFLDSSIEVCDYHPKLQHTTDIYYATATNPAISPDGRKHRQSVYDSVDFNVDTTTPFDTAGCGCHAAHNPYKSSSSEFSACFNCHGIYTSSTPDVQSAFDTAFMGQHSPLAMDDNTLLLVHFDKGYNGESKEIASETTGTKFIAGRFGFACGFDTLVNADTTRLSYPLWTWTATGAAATEGIPHNEGYPLVPITDMTIRFNNSFITESGIGSLDSTYPLNSTGVTFTEGYFGGATGAVSIDSYDTLRYQYSTTSIFKLDSGAVVLWVKITGKGMGVQETSKDRYLFLHSTTTSKPFRNAIYLRHSANNNTWDFGIGDQTGDQNIISAADDLTAGWHQIGASWSRSLKLIKMYIDGKLVAAESFTLVPKATDTTLGIWIGTAPNGEVVNTSIDEFQLSNYCKPDSEILADYLGATELNLNVKRGTLEFWVKPDWNGNDSQNHTFFENNASASNYMIVRKDSSNRLNFRIVGSGSQKDLYSSVNASNLPMNEWSHIAVSWEDAGVNNSEMNLYLNGVKVDSTYTATMMTSTGNYLYFGSRYDRTEKLQGALEEIWITDIRQTSLDIASVADGYSNVGSSSTSSTATSYLPNPDSLNLLLHYDTTYNGDNGEIPLYGGDVSFGGGKYNSALLIKTTGYMRYPSGDNYAALSDTESFFVRHFDNSYGNNIFESTGVSFGTGFLGGSLGAVLVDVSDILSYKYAIQDTTGIVGWWQINTGDNNEQNIYDSSGLGNNGFRGTGSSVEGSDPVWTVTGKSGLTAYRSLTFDGNGDFVNCQSPASFDFGAGNFTISAWIQPTKSSSYRYMGIVTKANSTRSSRTWTFVVDTFPGTRGAYTPNAYFGKLGFGYTSPAYTNDVGKVFIGNWYHVVAVRIGGTVYFYVNGVPNGSVSFSYSDNAANNVYIGTYSNSVYYDFGGGIDEVALFNRALDSTEVYNMWKYGVGAFNDITKKGTIQSWVYVNTGAGSIKDTTQNRYIFRSTTDTTTDKNAVALYHGTDNRWVFKTSDSTGTNYTTAAVTDNLLEGWHNFAATWDRLNSNLYINGVLKGTISSPYLPNAQPGRFYIGNGGSTGRINTRIDEFLLDTTLKPAKTVSGYITPNAYNYSPYSGTIEMWMKPYNWDSTDTSKHVFFDARIDSASNNSWISMYYDTDKKIKLSVYDTTGTVQGLASYSLAGILDSSAFHNYVGAWNTAGIYLYIDGQLKNSTTLTAIPRQRADFIFIGSDINQANKANAYIDEFRIFDTIRTPDLITVDAGGLNDYRKYYADLFDPYEGGSRHPINYDIDQFESSNRENVRYMECLKCHFQIDPADTTQVFHMKKTVIFVDVDSDTTWDTRKVGFYNSTRGYGARDNTTKKNVTLFCLSCHMNTKADPLDTSGQYVNYDTVTGAISPYTFEGANKVYGGNAIQLRPLQNDLPQAKPGGGYYYPVDTTSAHFDTGFGSTAYGDMSCIDCHDPHGSINLSLLQDFEENKDGKDYNRDNNTTRTIAYLDRENVRLYQLNEEKFCYWCHNGKFNSTGINRGWTMKNIEYRFSHSPQSHHMVDDEEQALYDVQIECSSCHNPHTARRDKLALNPKTGERITITDKNDMNNFCLGCHDDGGPGTSTALPTSWCDGVKFPGMEVNTSSPEWVGNSWNEFNKQSMSTGNKHFTTSYNISCSTCHDPHGTSNYRMMEEKVINIFNPAQTTYVYNLKLINQVKPDDRNRYEVYSTTDIYGSTTRYTLNRFCAACHWNTTGIGRNPDYPGGNIYPGYSLYDSWDFGAYINSTRTAMIRYDSLIEYNATLSGNFMGGAAGIGRYITNPDIYGKDKDCDYCHNPHSSDTLRVFMVRDDVPQDLDRFSKTYGDRVDSKKWFRSGYAATGVDFCLSKGCHLTSKNAKLGPQDYFYLPTGSSNWWYKPYDQFNLLDFDDPDALKFSDIRPNSFQPDGNKYTRARASKHPIVSYAEYRAGGGNVIVCLSCHTPHGSPGNTELANVYSSTGSYPATSPQDNAGLRRAYYRRIYWWPVTFWKRGDPSDVAVSPPPAGGHMILNQTNYLFRYWNNYGNYDINNLWQNDQYFSPFVSFQLSVAPPYLPAGYPTQTGPGTNSGGHPLRYAEKVYSTTRFNHIPFAGNDLCFMCHLQSFILGDSTGIDTTKTRFIGHEAIIGGSKIGKTNFAGGTGHEINTAWVAMNNDFHQFTCSMCHGPHATTNEKLVAQKCFAFNFAKPPAAPGGSGHSYNYDNRGRPSVYCHPYDNTGAPNWNISYGTYDSEAGSKFYGWRAILDNTKTDFDRPSDSIDTLYIYFNTTRAYDTTIPVPGLGLPVKSNDLDVVLAWKSVWDSVESRWVHHYNVWRGDTVLTKENRSFKGSKINIWNEWGTTLVATVYDSDYATRPYGTYSTIYTIDPSIAHYLSKRYYYMVVPVDAQSNEAVTNYQDTTGAYFVYDSTPPRPVNNLTIMQEPKSFSIKMAWRDGGDNIASKYYDLYYYLDSGAGGTFSQWNTTSDTSFNTDIITNINFNDNYIVIHSDSTKLNSTSVNKNYVCGIKVRDAANNTTPAFATAAVKIKDPSPDYIKDLTILTDIRYNKYNTTFYYNINLQWSVPWDNAQTETNTSPPIYKIYRKLYKNGATYYPPISQNDINIYNLQGPSFTDIECITKLTWYNGKPVSDSTYKLGSTIAYVDNISPYRAYYYVLTSIDRWATDLANLDSTYQTDRDGYIFGREQIEDSAYNYCSRSLEPLDTFLDSLGQVVSMSVKKALNNRFVFSFREAVYDTPRFRQYNFYRRYDTDTTWTLGSYPETSRLHASGSCTQSGCHAGIHGGTPDTECTLVCHVGNARGDDYMPLSFTTGTYWYAASVLYYSTYIDVGGRTRWFNNLESPIGSPSSVFVEDIIPPNTPLVRAQLYPAQENGYDNIGLSWAPGTDINFMRYEVTKSRSASGVGSDAGDSVIANIYDVNQTTFNFQAYTPSEQWQTINSKYGGFRYTYKIGAYDSTYNYRESTVFVATRPSTTINFTAQALTTSSAIQLSWSSMPGYSETGNLGVNAYRIYGREGSAAFSSVYVPGTINTDTANGIRYLGVVDAVSGGGGYTTANMARYGTTNASSSDAEYPSTNINDGNIGSLWGPDAYDTFTSTYIELDLNTTMLADRIVYYNDYGDMSDSTQGYSLLTADTTQYSLGVWETVATKPNTTPRGITVYSRESGFPKYIRYIRITDFSTSTPSYFGVPAAVCNEIEVYYPASSSTTSFTHSSSNSALPVVPMRWYRYAIVLEDTTGYKGKTTVYPNAVSSLDLQPPDPVIDLAAWGVAGNTNSIYLKWSKPEDNVGVVRYQVWRHQNNPNITAIHGDDGGTNLRVSDFYSTANPMTYIDSSILNQTKYYYAIAALDTVGNISNFTGPNYSKFAKVSFDKDTIPPEPVTIVRAVFDSANIRVNLNWSPVFDKKDYTTTFQQDNYLYTDRVNNYYIYRTSLAMDSTPFSNELLLTTAAAFDTGGGYDTAGAPSSNVAKGWKIGTWGGASAPVIQPSIVFDPLRNSNVQRLSITNYVGDSKEQVNNTTNVYIKTAAYIKSVGYYFDSSASFAQETTIVHYLFGVWLKAEGSVSQQYTGDIYIDIGTKFNTGNETTFVNIGRRVLTNPGKDWTYYLFTARMPLTGVSTASENGVMIWATSNGFIWLDNAKLIDLYKPIERPSDTTLSDSSIVLNNVYYYAVTALDNSNDPGQNEGGYGNVKYAAVDRNSPIFDSVWSTTDVAVDGSGFYINRIDPDVTNPYPPGHQYGTTTDNVRTGSTRTIKNKVGVDPNDTAHTYDWDNIFRTWDAVTMKFRMLDAGTLQPELMILAPGEYGTLDVFYPEMDSIKYYRSQGQDELDGYYSFYFIISDECKADTPYNTVTHRYESLYRIRVVVKDRNGNGPVINETAIVDNNTTDNNPDSTFLVILDNTPPAPPQ